MTNKKILIIIDYLKNKLNLYSGFFCLYGSYATNTENNLSDIDLLYIDNSIEKAHRISEKYNNIDISLYNVSERDLINDSKGTFGGFFCGKLFNPHILIEASKFQEKLINKCIANYFKNLMSNHFFKKNFFYTSDDILKRCINVYIDLYPEYFAYIMRLKESENFNVIWNKWKKGFIQNLNEYDIISKKGQRYRINKLINFNYYNILKTDYISRFWIFAAISHNSNLNFYDYYKNKNKNYILTHNNVKKDTEKFLDQ